MNHIKIDHTIDFWDKSKKLTILQDQLFISLITIKEFFNKSDQVIKESNIYSGDILDVVFGVLLKFFVREVMLVMAYLVWCVKYDVLDVFQIIFSS
jgi:hypothetical protein